MIEKDGRQYFSTVCKRSFRDWKQFVKGKVYIAEYEDYRDSLFVFISGQNNDKLYSGQRFYQYNEDNGWVFTDFFYTEKESIILLRKEKIKKLNKLSEL